LETEVALHWFLKGMLTGPSRKMVQMRTSAGKMGVKGRLAEANLAKMAKITILEETKMLTRFMAAAAFATLAFGTAHAGTITGGVWTPTTCGANPGTPPEMDGKNQTTYTKSAKEFQTWQDKAKLFQQCVA
jgi:hypothetical protein